MKTCPFKKELEIGRLVEMEHNMGKKTATKIAKDHIAENSCYYSKFLIPMENKMKKS